MEDVVDVDAGTEGSGDMDAQLRGLPWDKYNPLMYVPQISILFCLPITCLVWCTYLMYQWLQVMVITGADKAAKNQMMWILRG